MSSAASARLSLVFSCLGHGYVHIFTSIYFVIVLALEVAWERPYHDLIELWMLGALLVGLGALPAGWLADRWSATGMMAVYFLGLGGASIACAFLDSSTAMLVGLASVGIFASIYHPVGIAWLVRNAKTRGKALGKFDTGRMKRMRKFLMRLQTFRTVPSTFGIYSNRLLPSLRPKPKSL